MKMKLHYLLVCVIISISVFAGYAAAQDENQVETVSYLDNQQFAYMVFNLYNLQMPAGTENSTPQQAYEIMTNMLAAKGISYFTGKSAQDYVTYGDFADVVYAIVGRTDSVTVQEKIDYLIANGYMEALPPDTGFGSIVVVSYATRVLNNPALATLVAEAYSEPGADDIPGATFDAQGATLEEPATQI